MASSKEYLDFVLEQLSGLDKISYRPMMGEYILYYNKKVVGGIYDNRLLVKQTKSSIALLASTPLEIPYEGAKKMFLPDVENKELLAKVIPLIADEIK